MTSPERRSPVGSFEAHARDVYGWAYRLLGRHHDALDVAQDVFLRWARQCTVAVPAHPRGWLRRVTLNRAIDLARSTRTSQQFVADVACEATPATEPTSTGPDQSLLRGDINEALIELSDMQRGVLIAKVFDDLSFAEIAAELGISVSTAKTHYLRALRAVGDRLRPRWENS